jgi:hypothetical protein
LFGRIYPAECREIMGQNFPASYETGHQNELFFLSTVDCRLFRSIILK